MDELPDGWQEPMPPLNGENRISKYYDEQGNLIERSDDLEEGQVYITTGDADFLEDVSPSERVRILGVNNDPEHPGYAIDGVTTLKLIDEVAYLRQYTTKTRGHIDTLKDGIRVLVVLLICATGVGIHQYLDNQLSKKENERLRQELDRTPTPVQHLHEQENWIGVGPIPRKTHVAIPQADPFADEGNNPLEGDKPDVRLLQNYEPPLGQQQRM